MQYQLMDCYKCKNCDCGGRVPATRKPRCWQCKHRVWKTARIQAPKRLPPGSTEDRNLYKVIATTNKLAPVE